jgi:hypothetical protein
MPPPAAPEANVHGGVPSPPRASNSAAARAIPSHQVVSLDFVTAFYILQAIANLQQKAASSTRNKIERRLASPAGTPRTSPTCALVPYFGKFAIMIGRDQAVPLVGSHDRSPHRVPKADFARSCPSTVTSCPSRKTCSLSAAETLSDSAAGLGT